MKLLVSALEPSANVHLERLMSQLPGVEIQGIFSDHLGKPLIDSREFSVMGFVDAFAKIPFARKAIDMMTRQAPLHDAVLLIDSSGFHIPLAKSIKKQHPHVKIIYYILPQVWAWRSGRIPVVEAVTDVQASILPFEDQFWKHAHYVGHPLMEEIRTWKNDVSQGSTVAFLPGSRRSEIGKLMPVYREVAASLPGRKLLVIPPHYRENDIAEMYGDLRGFEVARSTHEALLEASFAFVCSGTATLEATLIGTPFVLAYRAKALDYFLGRHFVKLPYIGLSNMIFHFAGRPPIHQEFLQDEVTAQNLLNAMAQIDGQDFLERSREMRALLQVTPEHSLSQVIERLVREGRA